MTVKHPAKFSDVLLPVFALWLDGLEPVLDPMAGVGKLAEVVPNAFLNELEQEWARQAYNSYPGATVSCGDARHLPYEDGFFAGIGTSPTYGNRMADHHNATEKCRPCKGKGYTETPGPWCAKCGGLGRRTYKRNTYRHQLGRALTPGNTGQLQFGDEYKAVTREIYTECRRVLQPGGVFVLNVSDFIRNKAVFDATSWHVGTMSDLGFELEDEVRIATPRNRQGQNHEARVEFESVFLFRKAT